MATGQLKHPVEVLLKQVFHENRADVLLLLLLVLLPPFLLLFLFMLSLFLLSLLLLLLLLLLIPYPLSPLTTPPARSHKGKPLENQLTTLTNPPPGRRVPPNRRNTNHPEKDRSIKSFWCVTVCSTPYLVEGEEKGVTLASVHAAQPRSSSSISTKSLNVVSGGVNKEPHLHSNHKLLSRCDGSQPRLISDSNDLRGPVAQGQPQGRPTYLLRKPHLKVQILPLDRWSPPATATHSLCQAPGLKVRQTSTRILQPPQSLII